MYHQVHTHTHTARAVSKRALYSMKQGRLLRADGIICVVGYSKRALDRDRTTRRYIYLRPDDVGSHA